MSGVVGEVTQKGPLAVQAWAAGINSRGGLNCHPVKYLLVDDGGDPNRHMAAKRQMVEQDKVITFVPENAPVPGFAAQNYINEKKIPVIGSEGGSGWFYNSPFYFPQGATGAEGFNSLYIGAAGLSPHAQGKKKVALISCIEAQACSEIDKDAEQYFQKYKLEMVYKGKGSITQPDFTSQCLRAKQAGGELFIVSMDGPSVHRVAKSCAGVGYNPQYVNAFNDIDNTNPVFENFVGATPTYPWFETSLPAIAEYHAVLKKFAPDLKPTLQGAFGWTAAKLFEIAARNMPEPPTSQAVLDGLYSMKNDNVFGLAQPLTFTNTVPTTPVLKCFWSPTIKGGTWTMGAAKEMICG